MQSSPQSTDFARLGRVTLGNSVWYQNQLITFLATGDDTSGRSALLRVHSIRGAEPPPHYHANEDETIYVLDGEICVSARGEELHAGRGESVTIPRGLEHFIRYETQRVTLLVQFSPSGFERFFYDLGEPAEYLDLPAHSTAQSVRMRATAAKYGCVFTGLDA